MTSFKKFTESKKTSSNKASSKKELKVPPVIPLTQLDTKPDGTIVRKKVKPLTYALMTWVKSNEWEDTIDISEDENSAQLAIDVPSVDEEYTFTSYFNTYETEGIITLCIYPVDCQIPKGKLSAVKELILTNNCSCVIGQIQLLEDNKSIRYYTAINLSGIASKDQNYTGEVQIHPQLIANMFKSGFDDMNAFFEEYIGVCSVK